MKKATIVTSDIYYSNNKLFDLNDKLANRDNCLFVFYLLKEELKLHGYDLATSDINAIKDSEVVIYNEMPKELPALDDVDTSFLLLFESELIRPDNWDISKHKKFKKIFTWNDNYIDNKKYYKANFSFDFPSFINKDLRNKKKLCTLISGNKRVFHPLELYSRRIEVIRWFECNHPEDFDLYGIGWNRYQFFWPKFIKLLNKVTLLTWLLAPNYPSYKGCVESKKNTLEQYKFCICFENAIDIPGYITEKIFDCFFAACVPVYLGANNIFEHIPSDCYVDMRSFTNYEKLYEYISSITKDDYLTYLNNIEKFLKTDKAKLFSAQYYVETLISQITEK